MYYFSFAVEGVHCLIKIITADWIQKPLFPIRKNWVLRKDLDIFRNHFKKYSITNWEKCLHSTCIGGTKNNILIVLTTKLYTYLKYNIHNKIYIS